LFLCSFFCSLIRHLIGWNDQKYQQVLALYGVFNKKICVQIGVVDFTWERVYIYIYKYIERSFEMCICLWQEFDHPEVTLYSWQDVKILIPTTKIVFGSITRILPKNGGGDVRIVIVFEMMGYKTLQMLFVFLLQCTF